MMDDHLPKSEMLSFFPAFRWMPINDGRTSHSHILLAKCGINGTDIFKCFDPIFEWWLDQRRKGFWTCRCDIGLIDKWTIAELHIEVDFAPPISFDPWVPVDECGRMGWGEDYEKCSAKGFLDRLRNKGVLDGETR